MAQKSLIHIGRNEVEKIPLGGGRLLYHLSDRYFMNDLDPKTNNGLVWRELAPGEEIEASANAKPSRVKLFLTKTASRLPGMIFFRRKPHGNRSTENAACCAITLRSAQRPGR